MDSFDKILFELSTDGTYKSFKQWTIGYLNITLLIKTVYMLAVRLDDQNIVFQTFIPLFINTVFILVMLFLENKVSKQTALTLLTESINIAMYFLGLFIMPDHKEIFIISSSVTTFSLEMNHPHIIYAYLHLSKLIIIWYAGPILLGQKSIPNLPSPYFVVMYSSAVLTLVLIEKRDLLRKHVAASTEIENMKSNLNNIIQAMPESVIIISKDSNIILYNNAFHDIFLEYDEEDITAILKSLVYAENGKIYISPSYYLYLDILHYLHSQAQLPVIFGTILYHEKTLEWRASKIEWQNCSVAILTTRDISSILDCERAKAETQRKTTLLRTVSHEIRTPTNAIISLSDELLQKPGMLPSELMSNIKVINISSKLLHNLLNDLLDFSKMVADCLSIDKIEFEIRPFLEETYELFALQCSNKKLNYTLNLDPNLPRTVVTDPNRLRQIIINLISNSLKFTLRGSIKLNAFLRGTKKLYIEVVDTGLGIPADKLEEIFTAFNRTHDIMLNPQGCGLVLYISNILAKALGGSSIRVESDYKRGSTFSFEIDALNDPLSQTSSFYEEMIDYNILNERENITIPKALNIHSGFNSSHSRVLIVDDDYFNRLVLKTILKESSALFDEAQSGYEALEKIQLANNSSVKIKLVILDYNMPGISGLDTYQEILRLYEENVITDMPKVVVYSADNTEECIEECKQLGIDDFLVKPATKSSLVNLLDKYL